jgi:hypothetical protein
MLVESALCLAEEPDGVPSGGWSWTPASAMRHRLLAPPATQAGLSFELQPAANTEGVEIAL